MSYQNPNQPPYGQPQQPQPSYGYPPQQPQQPYGYGPGGTIPPGPPPPPSNWFSRHKLLTVLGAIVAVIIIASAAATAGGGGGDDSSKGSAPAAKTSASAKANGSKPKAAPKAKPKPPPASQAQQFKAYVNAHGSPAEKAAVRHVTKVQGADKRNDILDSAEVFTDYSGGMMGPNASSGKLIASAFADWKHSKNGLVTVYDKAGEILSNGNF